MLIYNIFCLNPCLDNRVGHWRIHGHGGVGGWGGEWDLQGGGEGGSEGGIQWGGEGRGQR